jgi:hypothetical protein
VKRLVVATTVDLPLAGADRIVQELHSAFTLSSGALMVGLWIPRPAVGTAALATMTAYKQVAVIPTPESDAAWNRYQAPQRTTDLPPSDHPMFPAGSLRTRLATRRRLERTS